MGNTLAVITVNFAVGHGGKSLKLINPNPAELLRAHPDLSVYFYGQFHTG